MVRTAINRSYIANSNRKSYTEATLTNYTVSSKSRSVEREKGGKGEEEEEKLIVSRRYLNHQSKSISF